MLAQPFTNCKMKVSGDCDADGSHNTRNNSSHSTQVFTSYISLRFLWKDICMTITPFLRVSKRSGWAKENYLKRHFELTVLSEDVLLLRFFLALFLAFLDNAFPSSCCAELPLVVVPRFNFG